jgi:hypothetical protein
MVDPVQPTPLSRDEAVEQVLQRFRPPQPDGRPNIPAPVQPENINASQTAALPRMPAPVTGSVTGNVRTIPVSVLDRLSAKMARPEMPVDIESVEILPSNGQSTLRLALSAPVEYSVSYDQSANVLYIEMPYANWQAQRQWVSQTQNGLIDGYIVEPFGQTGARLVLRLSQAANPVFDTKLTQPPGRTAGLDINIFAGSGTL